MTLRRGFRLGAGERVVIVEDVVTTGKSTRETADVVRAHGLFENSEAFICGPAAMVRQTTLLLGNAQGGVLSCSLAEVDRARAAAAGDGGVAPAGAVRVAVTTQVVPGGQSDATWGVAASPDGFEGVPGPPPCAWLPGPE